MFLFVKVFISSLMNTGCPDEKMDTEKTDRGKRQIKEKIWGCRTCGLQLIDPGYN
jgi:hypothetical protein